MPVGALADRTAVATQLRDLADRPALAPRRDELTTLADALQGLGDSDLESWAELDLLAAYARPESVRVPAAEPDGPERAVWGVLEAVLGTLVFVPLLLTWIGLTRASSAYEALIGADPKMAARPFLQLWQTGFEGRLTGWSTFGNVALLATGAILVLLVLTAVHGLRRAREDRREAAAQRTAEDLLARLVPVLTRAQLLLNDERLTAPGKFTGELSKAAGSLGSLVRRAASTQKELTAAATVVGEAVDGAERRLAGVDAATRPIEQAVGRVEAAVRTAGDGVGKALDGVRTVNGEVRDALGAAGERVEDSVHTLGAAQRSFTTATEVATDVSARVLDRLGEVTEETARAVAGSQEAVRLLSDEARALRAAAERFADLVEVLAARSAPAPASPAPVVPAGPSGGGPGGPPPTAPAPTGPFVWPPASSPSSSPSLAPPAGHREPGTPSTPGAVPGASGPVPPVPRAGSSSTEGRTGTGVESTSPGGRYGPWVDDEPQDARPVVDADPLTGADPVSDADPAVQPPAGHR
ncbi:methyl-accepting chemotaxis protein [Streptomyces sp. NPDC002490]|uniref:methyl-accepting chemotaxis protein n=1 Tax=Streptomyces sp. NPDC002490 TaxID=3154416 RepID=UPI00332955DF